MQSLRSQSGWVLRSLAAIAVAAVICSDSVYSFSPSPVAFRTAKMTTGRSGLRLAATSTTPTKSVTEENAQEIYRKAREFAMQDTQGRSTDDEYDSHYHNIDDEKEQIKIATYWLNEIINLQSGCVTGTLVDADICQEVDVSAEIVANLRSKIKRHEQRLEIRNKGSDSVVPWIAMELSSASLLVVACLLFVTFDIVALHGDDIGPIENYQQFVTILQEKEYNIFESVMNRFS